MCFYIYICTYVCMYLYSRFFLFILFMPNGKTKISHLRSAVLVRKRKGTVRSWESLKKIFWTFGVMGKTYLCKKKKKKEEKTFLKCEEWKLFLEGFFFFFFLETVLVFLQRIILYLLESLRDAQPVNIGVVFPVPLTLCGILVHCK